MLFDDTIGSNIAYGSPDATRERDRGRGARRQRARLHRRDAARLRHDDRRARAAAVGRAAPAHRDRAGAAQERADPRARRGDLGARHRVGAAGAGSAGEPDDEPHVVRHRAPAVHDPPRRCDRRARARPHRRDRPPRGTAGAIPTAPTRRCISCSCSKAAADAERSGRGHRHGLAGASVDDQEHDRVRVADPRGRARHDRGDDPGASTTAISICSCAARSRCAAIEARAARAGRPSTSRAAASS